jgi:hypothetical protein
MSQVSICLDSWAVLAWLGEVGCQVERRPGLDDANLVVGRLRAPAALDRVTPARVLAAGRIRAAIAFADCFAVATARAHDATLLTGDPEILERDLGCSVRDLRG